MRYITRVDDFALFEVLPEDENTPGTIGRPYFPGTVLIFPTNVVPELGEEFGWGSTVEEGELKARSLARSLALMDFEYKIARARRFADAYERVRKEERSGA